MKQKRFEELNESQKAVFHNMTSENLFSLYRNLRTIVSQGLCKARLEICGLCPIVGLTKRLAGWGGPMACSLIELEAASRGRHVPVSLLEACPCDQCGAYMESGSLHVAVPQYGYRTLRFCMKCVEASQY